MDGLSPPYGHQRLVAHRNRYTSPSLLALPPSRGIVPRYGWADHLVGRADAATPRTRLRRLGRSARRHVEQHHHQAISSATTVGFFGLLAALYSGIGWMANLRDALSAPWGNAPTRPPIVRLVRAAPFGARVGCHVRGHWAAVRVGLSGAGVPRARRADGGAEALVTPLGVLIGLATNCDPHVGDRPPPACTGGPAQHRQGGRVGCGGVYAPAGLPLAPRLAAATAPGGARWPRSGMGGDESGAGLRVLSVTPEP